MKLNDKINLIREELNNEIKPIDAKQILDNAHIAPKEFVQKKPSYFSIGLRTAFIIFLALAIIIPTSLILGNNGMKDQEDAIEDKDDSATGDKGDKADPGDVPIDSTYGFITTSAVVLSYNTYDIYGEGEINSEAKTLLVYNELNNLNRFLAPIQMLISSDSNYYYREQSDNNLYANKIVYEGLGLLGEKLYYKIYYNESLENQNKTVIDTLVMTGTDTINLKGEKVSTAKGVTLNMKYFVTEEYNENYIEVSKNLNDSNAYIYRVVRGNNIISNNKLSLIQNNEMYAKLESINEENKLTTFNIHTSDTSNFQVEYSIASSYDSSDSSFENEAGEAPIIDESGNIAINFSSNSFIFNINSN